MEMSLRCSDAVSMETECRSEVCDAFPTVSTDIRTFASVYYMILLSGTFVNKRERNEGRYE